MFIAFIVCEAEYCFKVCYFSVPLCELHFSLVKLRLGIVLGIEAGIPNRIIFVIWGKVL